MAVYVDTMRAKFKRMVMCHMIADSLEELHAMAEKIGMKREWFQDTRWPHYDVSLSRKKLAIQYGAKEINRRELMDWMKRKMEERNEGQKGKAGDCGLGRDKRKEIQDQD
jgi:hypothetical protein